MKFCVEKTNLGETEPISIGPRNLRSVWTIVMFWTWALLVQSILGQIEDPSQL